MLKEPCEKHWEFEYISEIHIRCYNSLKNSFELFLHKGKSYFFTVYTPETLNEVFKTIEINSKSIKIVSNQRKSFNSSKYQQKWLNSEISNFEYLMRINTYAGRSYNEINQYPVFPWTLTDFSSELDKLDLNDAKSYRNLRKPIGALNDVRLRYLKTRMKEMQDIKVPFDLQLKPFLYGTHYSGAGQIMHFLIRLEPISTICTNLQSGKFDCADRLFFDINETWKSCQNFNSDFKELIPEFYYSGEFLRNRNNFDFGLTQNGINISNVILPVWAKSPDEFVFRNRQALEGSLVSNMLNHWIDLIFGYKQQGEESIKADNIFYYMTYEV